jgi:hypothetical protein
MSDIFENYGHLISDNSGDLRDISGIIFELEEIEGDFETHAMSDYTLYLQGKKDMLNEVIQYLKRI